jgi:hypothetical protein
MFMEISLVMSTPERQAIYLETTHFDVLKTGITQKETRGELELFTRPPNGKPDLEVTILQQAQR